MTSPQIPNFSPFLIWLLDQGLSASTSAAYVSHVSGVFRAHASRGEAKLNAATLHDYHASLPTPRRTAARAAWRRFLAFARDRGVAGLPDVAEVKHGPRSMLAVELPTKVTERDRAIHAFVTRLGFGTARSAKWTMGTPDPLLGYDHVLIAPGLTVTRAWFVSYVRVMFPETNQIIPGWPMVAKIDKPVEPLPEVEIHQIYDRVQFEIEEERLTLWDASPEAVALVEKWAVERAARPAGVTDEEAEKRDAAARKLFGED